MTGAHLRPSQTVGDLRAAFVEADEVAVPRDLWERVKAGDADARDQLKQELDGIELYLHILSLDETPTVLVTIRELNEAHVIETVTIRTRGHYQQPDG